MPDQSKHKDYLEVIDEAKLGVSIPSLTASKAHVYDLEVAIQLLVKDGMSTKEAYDWVRKMNNQYIGGPNPVFVTDENTVGHGDLGWSV